MLNAASKEWRHRFVGDNINIQMDLFKMLNLKYHEDKNIQTDISNKIKFISKALELVEKEIEYSKLMKKLLLNKMFVQG